MTEEIDTQHISRILSDIKIRNLVERNLDHNLPLVGFSDNFCEDLKATLIDMNVKSFRNRYAVELETVYEKHFFGKVVPDYFKEYIFPQLKDGKRILDYGCGSGELSYNLSKEKPNCVILGIDIVESSNWETYRSPNLDYRVIDPGELLGLIGEINPEVFICTWVLHHMDSDQQESLFKILSGHHSKMELIILEDSYSNDIKPTCWPELVKDFDLFQEESKIKIIYAYDWIANKIFSGRYDLNMPKTYKTIEQWSEFAKYYGFTKKEFHYIGVPQFRDISSPQALLIFS